MISVDTYLTCYLEDTGIYIFSGCNVPPDSKETKLGSSNQEAFLSAGKNTRLVLVQCHG